MTSAAATLEMVNSATGLAGYLAAVEDRLAAAIASHPGVVADVGADALPREGSDFVQP